jgi:ribosomal protein S18 acetylase RimI-like enzyme
MIRINQYTMLLHDQLVSLLLENKKSCVSFIERVDTFLKGKNPEAETCFLLRGGSNIILGAVLFTQNGLVFHCLPPAGSNQFCEGARPLLTPLFAERYIYCITGALQGTQYLAELCKINKRTVSESRVFHLMEYAPQETQTASSKHAPPVIMECVPEHENALYPLRKAYELEEVFPEGVEFLESVCRNNLHRVLEEESVVAVPRYDKQGEFMSMAAINGKAEGIAQIGGVYTLPEFRSKGYAGALTKYLAERINAKGNESVLFVRIDNAAAIQSYENAGFIKNGHYGITYYKQ